MKTIDELREESKGQTRFLYPIGYWDGPITGIMLWNGEKAYFKQSKEDTFDKIPFTKKEIKEWKEICKQKNWKFDIEDCYEYNPHRYYNVYRLPKDILKKIEQKNKYFCWFVGTHNIYDKNGKMGTGALISKNGKIKDRGDLKPYFLHKIYYKFLGKMIKYNIETEKYEILGEFEL